MEEKIALPDEQMELKKRIGGDLKLLDDLDDTVYGTKGLVLSEGYERIGDKASVGIL